MKKIIYSLFVCLSLALVSCDESTEDHSMITHYVEFTMDGDEVMAVALGIPYTEPGVKVSENGKDVSSTMVTEGTEDVNTDEIGVYYITYSAENSEGYPNDVTRTVVVYDPNVTADDISGSYVTTENNTVVEPNTVTPILFKNFAVTLEAVAGAEGVYTISDFLGGYFAKVKGRGGNYAVSGYLAVDNNNKITYLDGADAATGVTPELSEGLYTSASKTLTWNVLYKDYAFKIELKK